MNAANANPREELMIGKMLTAATIAVFGLTTASALAQGFDIRRVEGELHAFHSACDHGDRGACIRFGIILGEHPEAREEWRRTHPEFFWWEHH